MKHSLRLPLPLLLVVVSAMLLGTIGVSSADDGVYVKKATWPETMLASRAKLQQMTTEEKPDGPPVYGPWYVTPSLRAESFGQVFPPEKEIDLDAKDSGGAALWTLNNRPDGIVHSLPGSHKGSTYLYRKITASADTDVECSLGSDDGIAVFLNGEKILEHDVPRGPGPDQDHCTLKLKKGDNQLLLKIHNNSGGHGYYFKAGGPGADSPAAELSKQIAADFPKECDAMKKANGGGVAMWLAADDSQIVEIESETIRALAAKMGNPGGAIQGRLDSLAKVKPGSAKRLELFEDAMRLAALPEQLKKLNPQALRLAIEDLMSTYGNKYPKGAEYLKQLDQLEAEVTRLQEEGADAKRLTTAVEKFGKLREEATLANPLLDFDRLLLVRRSASSPKLGLPQNWQGNCALSRTGYDNEIDVLSPVRPGGKLTTIYRPDNGGSSFVGDVDLHFDGDRMLFSMPNEKGIWEIWEINVDGSGLRQVTQGKVSEAHCYDACYLPSDKIVFGSTACYHGVPCVGGGNTVANLFVTTPDGSETRQLCFDQDHNWTPSILNNGKVLYTRWEYSDSPHYFTRLLMEMNPDGTAQMEYYGSNSLWPNSFFYARAIPDHPTKIVSIISGHHGVPRMGEMVIFDPAKGRHEASGAVQRIPGYGKKVEPVVADGLVNGSWPKFLHPYPLSEKYFLVSAQPTASSKWGIYLVDIFDNMTLIIEEDGYVMFEPVPLRPRKRPPVIPEKVRPGSPIAMVFLTDVHFGRGLKGVPRGTVKKLRIFEQHYAYPGMGGHINIGIDGPWDAKRIIGTVPVEADGSASFIVPANTPLAVQPLDADGRAVQVMRSWFVAQPGEVVSCIGCHEDRNSTPPAKMTIAARRPPSVIQPWYGDARGFSFAREVQPVLDEYCIGCHDGKKEDRPNFCIDGPVTFRNFTPSYTQLHRFVRRPGPESDYYLQQPMEWHASTSELIQMLEKGHKGVKLDAEAWDRLTTWIDLNVPDKGNWSEHRGTDRVSGIADRRAEMRKLYAGIDVVPEAVLDLPEEKPEFIKPEPIKLQPRNAHAAGWPFSVEEAQKRVAQAVDAGLPAEMTIELAEGISMQLKLIPAGEFVMGGSDNEVDEYPAAAVKIDRPYYIGQVEVTNAQYAAFDAEHDNGVISMSNKDQGSRGYFMDKPNHPVVRVTWDRAMAFCRWLSEKTGQKVSLPTEAQWEWAARAGSDSATYYGDVDADFGKFANLADATAERLANRDSPKWHPIDARYNDGQMISTDVARYQPNAWGLQDMIGNVAEWTLTSYKPYPYDDSDGRNAENSRDEKSVRGGSWFDRPYRARSGFREHYQPWQRVYNVGFRVVIEAPQ